MTTDKREELSMEQDEGAFRTSINGIEMPLRIWLTDEGSGDICWANEPDPSGDGNAEAVEYVRADTTKVSP